MPPRHIGHIGEPVGKLGSLRTTTLRTRGCVRGPLLEITAIA